MITFESETVTAFETDDSALFVRAASSHPIVQSLRVAAGGTDDMFRQLAQVVVEYSFDVPPFVCLRRTASEIHLFLIGEVTARVAGPQEIVLDGTGSSTWTEHTVPIDADITLRWKEAQIPPSSASPRSGSNVPGTLPHQIDQPVDERVPTESTAPVSAVEQLSTDREAPLEEAPSQPDPALQTASPPPELPDPNLLGTDLVGIDQAGEEPPPEPASTQVESATASADPPATPEAEDPDLTLDADEVRKSLDEDPQTPPSRTSPLVTARVCPCGGPNPLGAGDCSRCGSSLRRDGVTIEQVSRPSIGDLVLDDGTRFALEDSFVVGRNVPDVFEIDGRPCPGISIESPTKQVSKVHLEVRLVDWTVNVVDLDSANGTYIEDAEGRAPKRLRPNVVEQITPGDTIHFGDRGFVFEATSGP